MLLICIIIFILFLLMVIWKRNNFTLLEILCIFFMVSTINQNVLDILTSNLKVMAITEETQMFWTSFMNRSFLIPILVVLLIDFLSKAKSITIKNSFILTGIFLLTGVEYFSKWAGVIKFNNWTIWYLLAEWGFIILLGVGSRHLLFYLYTKGTH